MPIINQENLNQLMSKFNSAITNVATEVTTGNEKFAQQLAEVWESHSAQETGGKIDEAVNSLWKSYIEALRSIYDGIDQNVKNHNLFNKGSVVLSALSVETGGVNPSHIKDVINDKFGDGGEGLKPDKSAADAGKVFDEIINGIDAEITQAAASIAGCKAFDEDETAAVSEKIKSGVLLFKNKMADIAAEVGTALTTVDTQAQELKSTNIGNMS